MLPARAILGFVALAAVEAFLLARYPQLFATLVTLILSALGLWGIVLLVRENRAAKRRSNNQCEHCGYDLRATPTRCPECGQTPHPTPDFPDPWD